MISIGACVGCGGASATPAREVSAPPAKVAPSASAVETTCSRACRAQASCGVEAGRCALGCERIGAALVPEVLDGIASCVERSIPPNCDLPREEGVSKLEANKALVGRCTLEAIAGRDEEAHANVELFVATFCERNQQCAGAPVPRSTCLGQARASIRERGAIELYGALRAPKVDELVTCLKGPCESRSGDANGELGRCLDVVLGGGPS